MVLAIDLATAEIERLPPRRDDPDPRPDGAIVSRPRDRAFPRRDRAISQGGAASHEAGRDDGRARKGIAWCWSPGHRAPAARPRSMRSRTSATRSIDNLPLTLMPRLLDGPPLSRPIALGIDVRNRDFSATALIELIDRLTANARGRARGAVPRLSRRRADPPLFPDPSPPPAGPGRRTGAGRRPRGRPAGADPGPRRRR